MSLKNSSILKQLGGTEEYDILIEMDALYERIEKEQSLWYSQSKFTCPSGCGKCCEHFEPDLLESEALYMAAWLLENEPEIAAKAASGDFPFEAKGRCPFFNSDSPYHCSIYNGRAFICRLFGASGSLNKRGDEVWKPCRFYPAEVLAKHNPPIAHRQYEKSEVAQLFGTTPPVMSDLMEQSLSITPDDDQTELLRIALPKALNKLLLILELEGK